MVIRTMWGAGIRAAAQHSQALYPIFTHVPGLKVVVPSNPYDAKGLLIEAIRDDDPVVFFENKVLYTIEGDVPEERYTIPFGEANIVREGGDVTIVALGREVGMARQAAEKLAADGIECEIIDLRTTSPLDEDTIFETVGRPAGSWWSTRPTRAAAWPPTSSRCVARSASTTLEAAPQMVTPPHTPVPFSPVLEDLYVPDGRADRGGGRADDRRQRGRGVSDGDRSKLGMPKWGLSMTEGKVTEWLVDEGAEIAVGDEMAEVETEKITGAVESPAAGVLRRRVAEVGRRRAGRRPARRDRAGRGAGRRRSTRSWRSSRPRSCPTRPRRRPGARARDGRAPAGPLRVLAQGEGDEVLVLLHGFGGDAENWRFNLDSLAERAHGARARPARARRARPRRSATSARSSTAVADVLDARGIEKAHLAGHSMGGAGRRRAGAQRPERVQSLALVAPAGFGGEINADYIDGFIAAGRGASSSRCSSCCSPTRGWSPASWSTRCCATSASTAWRTRCDAPGEPVRRRAPAARAGRGAGAARRPDPGDLGRAGPGDPRRATPRRRRRGRASRSSPGPATRRTWRRRARSTASWPTTWRRRRCEAARLRRVLAAQALGCGQRLRPARVAWPQALGERVERPQVTGAGLRAHPGPQKLGPERVERAAPQRAPRASSRAAADPAARPSGRAAARDTRPARPTGARHAAPRERPARRAVALGVDAGGQRPLPRR